MSEVFRELVKLSDAGGRGALAIVIGATGSTPGKESAKMLVRADGTTVGTIGGGCVEADVWALAREVLETERPLRRVFRLTPEEAAEDGLACGGTLEVYIEPVGSPTLTIFGAGHLAREITPLAKRVGLSVHVVDDRDRFANREAFPEADRVEVSPFDTAFEGRVFGPRSAIVIVTRGHRHDECVLEQAVRTDAGYVGLIGSRGKIGRIFKKLLENGAPRERLAAVRAPIGLDIGARTPEEIAVSVVAELVQWRRRAWVKGDDPSRLAARAEESAAPSPPASPPPRGEALVTRLERSIERGRDASDRPRRAAPDSTCADPSA